MRSLFTRRRPEGRVGLTPEQKTRDEEVAALSKWAAKALMDPRVVILDTETTGLHPAARIVELAVIAPHGHKILMNILINPGEPIPREVRDYHGISDVLVARAPRFAEILPRLEAALRDRRVLIYNAEFDVKRLGHELNVHRGDAADELAKVGEEWLAGLGATAEDVMVPYSDWVGDWSERHGNYRYQPLDGGHRAFGDCRAVVARLYEMATRTK